MSVDRAAAAVVTWRPEYRDAFERLNLEWIEGIFGVEEEDLRILRDPETIIIEAGGEVFFVVDGEGVRGTCAVIPHGAETFELAKMAVAPAARGRGYGDLLVEAAVAFARARGARKLMLVSNTRLAPALTLYRKHGFQEVTLEPGSGYSRANIQLELPLDR